MIYIKRLIFLLFIVNSCQSIGQLKIENRITNELKEVSAAEMAKDSDIIWVIQDAGNDNNLIGLDNNGQIVRNIYISNAKNKDWEDLTSDNQGHIYIGDFGNNNKKRKTFKIYKVNDNDLNASSAVAAVIEFSLPKNQKSEDFESFFIYNNYFYIFSKENKKFVVLKVKNSVGKHVAEVHSEYKLKGKNNKITSADISEDGKTVILLNHDKLWKITNFEHDDFFSGEITEAAFGHDSQKEGICFKTNSTIIITDERKNSEGGYIYSFNLN
ncbi:SdiA-regulated domain-containing protein [Winogradskyella helgolandensis]|uniref:SdiA-regulated domain-containing protein n=1 Tax=Winogradskyella helgolandensis TaxID=2697010 RepID=UPI0015C9C368|nr:SdiA-regulated domain-containing protein [Winogradskyella helgolandensis]